MESNYTTDEADKIKMYHYTSLDEDLFTETNSSSQDIWASEESPDYQSYHPSMFNTKTKRPLREKNSGRKNSVYKHVPHKEKPAQVVAKRNARERRRVQAVNSAFVRLRNAVPIQNTRGKRISKVKTLLYAMEYIRALDKILQNCGDYASYHDMLKNQQDKTTGMDCRDHWQYEKDETNLLKYFV